MKKVMVFVAVLAMVALAFGALAAEQKTTTTPAKAAPAPKIERFSGAIAKVDELGKTFDVKKMVKVKGKKEEKIMTFTAGDKTKITKGKEVKTFLDLKDGMDVTVQYTVEAGKNMAEAVKIAMPKVTRQPATK